MCALRGGSCAYINPSSALAGPACRGQANPTDCARFQALSRAQDEAPPRMVPSRAALGVVAAHRAWQDMQLCHEGQAALVIWFLVQV